MKHRLDVKCYARYTDDFVIIAEKRHCLVTLLPLVKHFLDQKLNLSLHPGKVSINSYGRGVDYLGYVVFPHYIILRSRTRRRIETKLLRRTQEYESGIISKKSFEQTLQSYFGVLSHADAYKLTQQLKHRFWMI